MELKEALTVLARDGYCLWVGAGVTKQLSSAGDELAYDWHELVERLELTAGLTAPVFPATLPERIQVIESKLGRVAFQKRLRELLMTRLAESIMQAAEKDLKEFHIPGAVRQIAHLGTMASQIVNFNIETWTSAILAGSSGPFAIKSFEPPVVGASGMSMAAGSSLPGRYVRSVLHPHGALDTNGLCVLTQHAYDSMNGTLAFQLAVHAAFQDKLAIVGMSLEDEYLRKQLAQFRKQIQSVFWFVKDEPKECLKKWIWANDITVVQLRDWEEFWREVGQIFPPPDETLLCQEWMRVISLAFFHSLPLASIIMSARRELGTADAMDSRLKALSENRGEEADAQTYLPIDVQTRYNRIEKLNRKRIKEVEEQKSAK